MANAKNSVTVKMQPTAEPSELIQAEIDKALALEQQVASQVAALKAAQEQINGTWKAVEAAMITHNIKSIKGSYGSITIAERTTFETDINLPDEFKKLVPDTKKIGTHYALYGEPPEGATPVVTRYLTKRLK